ncbi:MAG TPA: Smr/MutS family protein, partial [Clostridia bacterium]|nr:Smr/MutS family protein [Clostridia bacterium]
EALLELDRYLDDAALVGLSQVQLIHGKGTGALRRGIHEHLRHDKRVKQFRLGNYGEGDAGVTVVTLRE